MNKSKKLLIISNEIYESSQEDYSYQPEAKDFSFYQKPSRVNSKKNFTKKKKKSKKDDYDYD